MDLYYQLYSSRKFGPLVETLKMLAELGYAGVEGYGGILTEDLDPEAFRAALDRLGLVSPSMHVPLDLVEQAPERVWALATALGADKVIVPYLAEELRPHDGSGWQALGTRLEAAHVNGQRHGLTVGWHNHDFEFAPLADGSEPMAHLLAGGATFGWQVDAAWIARAKADPLDWIERYGERIISVHVKDLAPKIRRWSEGGWADLGDGILDWPALFSAARGHGVGHFVLEHDDPSDDKRFASRSFSAAQRLLEGA